MNGLRVFRIGLSRAARYRWVLAAMVAVSFASALVAAAPRAVALVGPAHRPGPAFRPAIREAVDGVDAWMLIEAVSTPPVGEGRVAFAWEEQQWIVRLALLTMGALLLLAWLSGAFLSGGALLAYADDEPLGWQRFLRGCWRWFGPLLLFSALQAVGAVLVFGPLLGVGLAAIFAVGDWMAWVVVPLLLIMALLWLALMELSRVAVVVGGKRNVVRAFGRAVRFVFRHPLGVGVLYGLSSLSWVILYALYRLALVPRVPRDWWMLAFVLQQAFVAIWLWVRLGRWAGGVALYQVSGERDSERSN
jgi:hypothetical protein